MSSVSYSRLLRENRNFRLLWAGQLISLLGDWFSAIPLQVLLLHYTGSASAVAGFIIATMLPGFLLAPMCGVIVDRFPRRAVMIVSDLARAVIALGLLGVRGPETVWVAYACMAMLSVFSVLFDPARSAVLPNIVSKEELVSANALSAVTWSIMLTSGALAGGIVAKYLGTDTVFILNSLSFIVSALFLARMVMPQADAPQRHPERRNELLEGFRYVRRHPEIVGALTSKMGWGLAGGVQVLLPIYGTQLFRLPNDPHGHLTTSLLMAAGGIGTAIGPVVARRITGPEPSRIRWAIAVSFLLGAIYYACMAGAPGLALVVLFLLLARFHGSIVWVFSTVLLQLLTEDRYRGRVFAVEVSLFTGAMMLSSVLTGRAIDLRWATVPQITLALAGVSFAVGLLWVARLARGPLPAAGLPERPPEPVGEGSGEAV